MLLLLTGCLALGLRSSSRELDARLRGHLGASSLAECEKIVEEVAGPAVGPDFGARLRRHCAASKAVKDKAKCSGVTRMAEESMVAKPARTPKEACTDIEAWMLTIARDLHALDTTTVSDPACVAKVQQITKITAPVPAANFSAALKSGCEVSCEEVNSVADRVLADVKHNVTPKAYCRLHEDWLEHAGIYDVDVFFTLVLGEEAQTTDADEGTGKDGSWPDALQGSRDENGKIFDILARKPEAAAVSCTGVVGVLALAVFATA